MTDKKDDGIDPDITMYEIDMSDISNRDQLASILERLLGGSRTLRGGRRSTDGENFLSSFVMVAKTVQLLWSDDDPKPYGKAVGEALKRLHDRSTPLGRCRKFLPSHVMDVAMQVIEERLGPWSSVAIEEVRIDRRRMMNTPNLREFEDSRGDNVLPRAAAYMLLSAYEADPPEWMRAIWPEEMGELPTNTGRAALREGAIVAMGALERFDRREVAAGAKANTLTWRYNNPGYQPVEPVEAPDDPDAYCEQCQQPLSVCSQRSMSNLRKDVATIIEEFFT